MPRSYSFDHFTVPGSAEPARPEAEKARVSGAPAPRGDRRPRYGKRFAETEDLAHARQMNRQLEELAHVGEPKISRPREPGRHHRGPEPRRHQPEPAGRGAPIGALPAAEALPRDSLRDLWEKGQRHVRSIRQSVRDGAAAGLRLLALPLEVVKLAARRAAARLPAGARSGAS